MLNFVSFINSFIVALTRFPFDWNNPIGYFFAFTVEYVILGYEFFMDACILSLIIGAYCFAISATKEIKRILHLINEKARANRKNKKKQQNEMKILLTEFIDIHATTKQLSTPKFSNKPCNG